MSTGETSKCGVPYYSDLLGQEELVTLLSQLVEQQRVPHALLLSGEDGGEAFSLALALARHLLCTDSTPDGACGVCHSCRQLDRLEHPDLELVFPIIKEGTKESTSVDFLADFRDMVLSEVRFTEEEWRTRQDAKNKQLQILVAEAERLIHSTSLRSFSSRYQIILVWLPELMRVETANKLLKLIEEPPEGVIFLMVSHQPDLLLPTIISRLQKVIVPAIPEEVLVHHLIHVRGTDEQLARKAGHLAQGNLYKAMKMLKGEDENSLFSEALDFLALPLLRNPKQFREYSEGLSTWSRPDLIALLEKVSEVLREVLALRYGGDDVVYLADSFREKAEKIANTLAAERYPRVLDEMIAARQELRQNANVKIVLFDLLLTLAMHYAQSMR